MGHSAHLCSALLPHPESFWPQCGSCDRSLQNRHPQQTLCYETRCRDHTAAPSIPLSALQTPKVAQSLMHQPQACFTVQQRQGKAEPSTETPGATARGLLGHAAQTGGLPSPHSAIPGLQMRRLIGPPSGLRIQHVDACKCSTQSE